MLQEGERERETEAIFILSKRAEHRLFNEASIAGRKGLMRLLVLEKAQVENHPA